MIKGIKLSEPPNMGEYSDPEILGELDPLKEYEEPSKFFNPAGEKITRRVHYSDKLYITTYMCKDESSLDTIWTVYDILNMGAKNYIRSIRVSPNVIVCSWPKYDNKVDDATYTLLIEEITRIAAFFVMEFGAEDITYKYIEDYLKLCVKNG